MPTHPDYVQQTLPRAREEGQWHAAQADAAALCFDVLALFANCRAASNLVYEAPAATNPTLPTPWL